MQNLYSRPIPGCTECHRVQTLRHWQNHVQAWRHETRRLRHRCLGVGLPPWTGVGARQCSNSDCQALFQTNGGICVMRWQFCKRNAVIRVLRHIVLRVPGWQVSAEIRPWSWRLHTVCGRTVPASDGAGIVHPVPRRSLRNPLRARCNQPRRTLPAVSGRHVSTATRASHLRELQPGQARGSDS